MKSRLALATAAVAVLAALAPASAPAATTTPRPNSPLVVTSASLKQDGLDLVLTIQTKGEWAARALTSRPGRSLCLILFQGPRKYVCASATASHGPMLTYNRSGANPSRLAARIQRPNLKTIMARFAAKNAGLRVGSYRWVVTSTWSDTKGCATPVRGCNDRFPDRGSKRAKLLPPTPTGCKARSPWLWFNASRSRRVVALTFDDGPSLYTHQVLDILKRNGIHGTFFLIGQQVSGGAEVVRRALREGNALGNHSWNHANLSGGAGGQLSSTQAVIRRTTGYTPCIFRPPYGAVSSLLVGQARSLGLDTINWDVDPRDWSRPGSGAIYSRIVGATHPGSIILMHDGGGPRDQTVAALPGIISTLRHRGYRFATVPELLGLKPTY